MPNSPVELPVEQMITEYENGTNILKLATRYRVGQARVRALLSEAGVLRSAGQSISDGWSRGDRKKSDWRRPGASIDIDLVTKLHGEGMNPSEIGAQLNVAMKRVQAILSLHGLIPGAGRHECKICNLIVDGHAGREVCRTCVPEDFFTRWQKYGISKPQYDSLLAEQGGHCGLCNEPGTCVDHDHVTGAIRGILCNTCNVAMAAVDHDIKWTIRARAYKERSA